MYLFIVKEKRPVGPRDVMRGARLSSPSVAYRHLQKLETMGLLIKNENGNYIAKEKAAIRGYVWVVKISQEVIPEFPSWIFLPLFVTATLIGILVRKRLVRT